MGRVQSVSDVGAWLVVKVVVVMVATNTSDLDMFATSFPASSPVRTREGIPWCTGVELWGSTLQAVRAKAIWTESAA